MSDDEHHFESKADAGASKTFPQQAGTIRKNAYIVIKQRPCKVTDSQGIFFSAVWVCVQHNSCWRFVYSVFFFSFFSVVCGCVRTPSVLLVVLRLRRGLAVFCFSIQIS